MADKCIYITKTIHKSKYVPPPQGLNIGEKLLWKYDEARYFVFFPWAIFNIKKTLEWSPWNKSKNIKSFWYNKIEESVMFDVIKYVYYAIFLDIYFPTSPPILPVYTYFYDVTHDTFQRFQQCHQQEEKPTEFGFLLHIHKS